jgi:DNA-binding NarL/FixJ family response regulator
LTLLSTASEPDRDLQLALLLTLGGYAIVARDHGRTRRLYQQVLEITEPCGENVCRSVARWGFGMVAWREGDDAEAAAHTAEAIRIEQPLERQDRYVTALSVEVLAWVAARQRRYRRAATLLGAADALLTRSGKPLPAMLNAEHAASERQICAGLGESAYADAFRHGHALRLDEAVAFALDKPRKPRPRPPVAETSPSPLTAREHQVAELIAAGLPNKEIAYTLFISQRTVAAHVEHILIKLGFANRAQIAAWVTARRGGQRHGRSRWTGTTT